MPTLSSAHLGNRDPLISILQTALKPNPKKRHRPKIDMVAIERFKQPSGIFIYLQTPIPESLYHKPERLKAYLDDNRRQHGKYLPTDHEWQQGTKYSGNKDRTATAKTTATTQYTSEISGNLAHKSPAQIKRIIRQAEAQNKEFMAVLVTS